MEVDQSFPPCICTDGAGLASDPVQDALLGSGVFETALSCFRSPPPCIRGFLPLQAVDRFVELLGGGLPLVGKAVLSERGSLCAAMWEEFLSGSLPLLHSCRERGGALSWRQARPSCPRDAARYRRLAMWGESPSSETARGEDRLPLT